MAETEVNREEQGSESCPVLTILKGEAHMNFLWLSRHEMSEQQAVDVKDYNVIKENMTYAASGPEAARNILSAAAQHKCKIVGGVFPAHVAVELVKQKEIAIWLPVSIPAPAKEGEERGFTFSHWEIHLGYAVYIRKEYKLNLYEEELEIIMEAVDEFIRSRGSNIPALKVWIEEKYFFLNTEEKAARMESVYEKITTARMLHKSIYQKYCEKHPELLS